MTRKTIAESQLTIIEWSSDTQAYIECPGKQHHTGANAKRDCRLELDGAPTITCFHSSCSDEVAVANKKIRSIIGKAEKKGAGYKFESSVTSQQSQQQSPAPAVTPEPKSFARKYVVDPFITIPDPIPDGTRELLRAAFEPGEGVRIAQGTNDDEGKEIPNGSGVCLSRDEWLKKLDDAKGDPNKFMRTSSRNGIFISVNPLRIGGSKDADVVSYRHCLLEFDTISATEQWALIHQSHVPASAVISSGGKSIHAWVRVDAKDRKEYDTRVSYIYKHFAEWKPDEKNKNPSRFSRLANCERGKNRQELIAIKIGAESFSEWVAELEVDGIGTTVTIDELMEFDADNDPNVILGKRWLCKGGSCLFVGQSGIGKSSLAVQCAATWGVGLSVFGVLPVKPLKSLFVQAENDIGDLSEMLQGVLGSTGWTESSDELHVLKRNLIFVRDTIHTGFEFCESIQRLIDKHEPDLVWVDPLLSFIGDDISKQQVCSQFLRNWIGPISEATGVCWMFVHHTGKPMDPKTKKGWTNTDHSYSGIGSSELTNWARAVCVLTRINTQTFELKLAKRGKRAEAKDMLGNRTDSIYLEHASEGIRWNQVEKPEEEPTQHTANKSVKVSKLDLLRPHIDGFIATFDFCPVSLKVASERLISFGDLHDVSVGSLSTAKTLIHALGAEGKLKVEIKADGNGYDISK